MLATASMITLLIEAYDLSVYAAMTALVIGPLFFPALSPFGETLAAFGTFATGFIARPIGAVLFSHIGDYYGRRLAFLASMAITGCATTGIGCLPTYNSVGSAAPLMLLLLRLVQGMASGGVGNGLLLVVENSPIQSRVIWCSLPHAGISLGYLAANGIVASLTSVFGAREFREWVWRVPFWLAALLVIAGLLLRKYMPESPEFVELVKEGGRASLPVVELLRTHWETFFLTVGAFSFSPAVTQIVSVWSLAYVTGNLNIDKATVIACVMVAVGLKGALLPFVAIIINRRSLRKVCLVGSCAMLFWAFPMMLLMHAGRPLFMMVSFIGAEICLLPVSVAATVYLVELYEPRIRSTGLTISHNFSSLIGGALSPLIAVLLTKSDGPPLGVAVYLSAISFLGIICLSRLPDVSNKEIG
ncbi:MFS transporter [Streptomyces aureoversilis]|uniref:MFS transporter n=1 Tax=Streptomyces aureoversilis TaxID=67277 RepID=A0ABW0ABV2_9ACTN